MIQMVECNTPIGTAERWNTRSFWHS